MMEASESSHTEWWQRQLARPREFSVKKQEKGGNEEQRTGKKWSRQSLDTMTSDLQNQMYNLPVLLFPCLQLCVVIQSSDTNWGWSLQMEVARESKLFLEQLVVEEGLMFEERF